MPKLITLDKGSKRRLKQIRWKLIEVFSLALLAVLLFGLSILVMLWELNREHPRSEPTKVPQIRNAEPTE
jgi:hypothetical protein